MKKSKVVFTVILGVLLVLGLGLAGCQTEDDDSGGDSGPAGVGSITITGIKGALNEGKIVYSTVSGTHELDEYTFQGGVMSGTTLDRGGSATINGGQVTIPVRGQKGGSSYEFKDGPYEAKLTVSGCDNDDDNKEYELTVTFAGSTGTGRGNSTNGLGLAD